MRLQVIKAGLAASVCVAAIGCGSAATNKSGAPNANSNTTHAASTPAANTSSATEIAAIKAGKDLYAVHCMTCHKDSGKGGKVTVDGKKLDPDDLTSQRMKEKSDEKLYNYIADGIVDEGMPAFKDDLKPDEIRAVVAHMRSLQN